ncbi:hypothetical protein ACFPH6_35505 [Streptomyces xiangluensis]|uniref:Uncharacterized protein n=1 Tax=Streptomyces xiangluensis TaxID=2665720 RepID=A0ABV8Z0T7_9ACTN
MPYTTEDLVASYEPATRRSKENSTENPMEKMEKEDWLEVGRLMRREGCCDAGH